MTFVFCSEQFLFSLYGAQKFKVLFLSGVLVRVR